MKLFFDTETSGLPDFKAPSDSPNQPFLVEFAGILKDDNMVTRGSLHSIVQPPQDREIPEEASKIHGITTDMAIKMGVPLGIVTDFFRSAVSMCEGNFVAHNINFDLRIMKIAFFQMSLDREYIEKLFGKIKPFCTMSSSTKIVNLPPTPKMLAAGFNKPKNPTLGECYKHFFGEEFQGAHSAMADTKGCVDVYTALTKGATV